jgi:hypothetical protein
MLWMTTIFMPLNDVREKIIIEKAYLIVEEQMPQCLLDFVTHVVGYKAVLAKWAEGDYSERRSTIGWPPEFDIYVERSYAALKAEQTKLAEFRLGDRPKALVFLPAPNEHGSKKTLSSNIRSEGISIVRSYL